MWPLWGAAGAAAGGGGRGGGGGQVVRVADFGAFVEMEGFSKWGLVHVTQLVDSSRNGGARVRAAVGRNRSNEPQ